MKIRLWKLGDLDKGILPTKSATDKLRKMIENHKDKDDEFTDIVWGPDLNVYEFNTVETIDANNVTTEEIQEIINGGTQNVVLDVSLGELDSKNNSHINNLVKEHIKKLLDNQK